MTTEDIGIDFDSALEEALDSFVTEYIDSIFEGIMNMEPDDFINMVRINNENNFDGSLFEADTVIERLLNESFEEQPDLEKTDYELEIDSIKYNVIENDKEKNCSICLSDFDNEDMVSCIKECQHIFHTNCIKEWGKYKTTCPVCRNNI